MNYTCTYSKIDAELTGKKIGELMHAFSVDVKTLANSLGVSSQAVYKWLNGKSLPTLENLFQISRIFDVPMDEIVKSTDYTEYSLPPLYVREGAADSPYSAPGNMSYIA